MFRDMRRKGNQTTESEAEKILNTCTNGVLSVIGDGGYPYGVPVSYVYKNKKIYFHGAIEGHKLDAIKNNSKVSFCVVSQDNIIPEEFNTLFVSVIAFGEAKILEGKEEKELAMINILEKYSGNYMENGKKYMEEQWDNCVAVEINVEHLTGKVGD